MERVTPSETAPTEYTTGCVTDGDVMTTVIISISNISRRRKRMKSGGEERLSRSKEQKEERIEKVKPDDGSSSSSR